MLKKLLVVLTLALLSFSAFADTFVGGHYRSDGTYVQPHYRSSPNSTVRDNFSYSGNRNPYTGSIGTNKYSNSPSSSYYKGNSGFPGFNR
jgi:hypothetical protein